jgi:peptide/nickel transport system permease protein
MFARYIARRLVHAVLLLFGVSVFSFLLLDLAPGDYFNAARLDPQISPEEVAGLRAQYGLTRPLPVRYERWAISAWEGNFGTSLAYNMPAAKLLGPRLCNTLLLTVTSLLLAWSLAIPLGVWSAIRKGQWPDRITGLAGSVLLSIPELLLACAVLFLAARTGVLPAGGMTSPGFEEMPPASRIADLARHMALPIAVLVAGSLPLLLRHVRAAVAELLDSGFVTAARAHGIPIGRIVWRHVLPAAANPLISLMGLSIGGLLSASLLVEVIMGWPGLGPLFLDAVEARDVHLIVGAVMASACFLIAGSLAADLLLYAVDPRIRVES